jgi:hypothetical protein
VKDVLEFLDELEKQLKAESYSKDYLGGFYRARYEIKQQFGENND